MRTRLNQILDALYDPDNTPDPKPKKVLEVLYKPSEDSVMVERYSSEDDESDEYHDDWMMGRGYIKIWLLITITIIGLVGICLSNQ